MSNVTIPQEEQFMVSNDAQPVKSNAVRLGLFWQNSCDSDSAAGDTSSVPVMSQVEQSKKVSATHPVKVIEVRLRDPEHVNVVRLESPAVLNDINPVPAADKLISAGHEEIVSPDANEDPPKSANNNDMHPDTLTRSTPGNDVVSMLVSDVPAAFMVRMLGVWPLKSIEPGIGLARMFNT